MSLWGSLFGGGAAKKGQQSKEAIVALRQQLDMLKKREAHTEKQIDDQDKIARKNVSTNKAIAKTALKRKKVLEKNLEDTQKHINTLESQMNSVETANLNVETLKVMKKASDAMKGMQGSLDIDKVDQTMDDIRERMTITEEISNLISNSIPDQVDADELDDELAQLEQEQLDEKMLRAPAAPIAVTPEMSNGVAVAKKAVPAEAESDDEEEELRRLQAEMAM